MRRSRGGSWSKAREAVRVEWRREKLKLGIEFDRLIRILLPNAKSIEA